MTDERKVPSETVSVLLDRIENEYNFECTAGPLKNCVDWIKLRAALAQRGEAKPVAEVLYAGIMDAQQRRLQFIVVNETLPDHMKLYARPPSPDAQVGKWIPQEVYDDIIRARKEGWYEEGAYWNRIDAWIKSL